MNASYIPIISHIKEILSDKSIMNPELFEQLLMVDGQFNILFQLKDNIRLIHKNWSENFISKGWNVESGNTIHFMLDEENDVIVSFYSDSSMGDYYLAVFLHKENTSIVLQQFTLLMEYLETQKRILKNAEHVYLKNDYIEKVSSGSTGGYMTVNKYGVIVFLNSIGAKLLEVQTEQLEGKLFEEVINRPDNVLDTKKTGIGWYNKEISICVLNRNIQLSETVVPVFDDHQEFVGVVITFFSIQYINKLFNNLTNSTSSFTFNHIFHQSRSMERLIKLAKAGAKKDVSVLIEGESGTGKELIAQAIHNESKRANGPFITIDCSSIPRELVESELFGYVDGAFTGARKGGKIGKFELANGGTVFLDEIGEMPLDLQVRLLRVLQSRCVMRVGGYEPTPIDIRIIAATNRNLEEEVEQNKFRLDLYYRLNVVNIDVPPLRERQEDVIPLALYLLEKVAKREGRPVPQIKNEVFDVLEQYSWPGNVRELENVMERALILCKNHMIQVEDLPLRLLTTSEELVVDEEENNNIVNQDLNIFDMESEMILKTYQECKGNKTKMAKILGISRSTLYEKLRQINMI